MSTKSLIQKLNIIKLHDLVSYQIAIFMYRFRNVVFNNFLQRSAKFINIVQDLLQNGLITSLK